MHAQEAIAASLAPPVRPLLQVEYQQLVEMGAFANEKVELIRGSIVRMSPQGYPHAYAVSELAERLLPALLGRARVLVQIPFIAGLTSMPEPDVSVIPLDGMARGMPSKAHLLIEVADSSLGIDRAHKLPLYAAAGIPEVWLLDIQSRSLFVHRGPVGDAWAEVFRVTEPSSATLLAFPDVSIPIAALFPAP